MNKEQLFQAYLLGGESFKQSLINTLNAMWEETDNKLELKQAYEEKCNRDFDSLFEQLPEFVAYMCDIISEAYNQSAELIFVGGKDENIN